jgi:hypothetical protein
MNTSHSEDILDLLEMQLALFAEPPEVLFFSCHYHLEMLLYFSLNCDNYFYHEQLEKLAVILSSLNLWPVLLAIENRAQCYLMNNISALTNHRYPTIL